MCNYPEMIINKSEGLNKSEQELALLCEKCFLNMWSYPNLFKDKKKGKELSDLLVIAGDNILLLSDKSCKFNDEIDQDIAWKRWYKKAVVDSINQLHKAKSWIEKSPTAIKLDPACKNNFPIVIDDIKNKKFYLIAIADVNEKIDFNISITNNNSSCAFNFHTHVFDNQFIHIFTKKDFTKIIEENDTTYDFIDYLDCRKKHIINDINHDTVSEKDLLFRYSYRKVNHFVPNCERINNIDLANSMERLIESDNYKQYFEKVKVSKLWDALILDQTENVMSGTLDYTNETSINEQFKAFHSMVSEKRVSRIALVENFYDFYDRKKLIEPISKRILIKSKNCSYGYLYLYLEYFEKSNYKEIRSKLLQECCQIAKVDYCQLDYIIGIAFTPIKETHIGNDFVYMDFTLWDTDGYNEAKELKKLHIQDGLCK